MKNFNGQHWCPFPNSLGAIGQNWLFVHTQQSAILELNIMHTTVAKTIFKLVLMKTRLPKYCASLHSWDVFVATHILPVVPYCLCVLIRRVLVHLTVKYGLPLVATWSWPLIKGFGGLLPGSWAKRYKSIVICQWVSEWTGRIEQISGHICQALSHNSPIICTLSKHNVLIKTPMCDIYRISMTARFGGVMSANW